MLNINSELWNIHFDGNRWARLGFGLIKIITRQRIQGQYSRRWAESCIFAAIHLAFLKNDFILCFVPLVDIREFYEDSKTGEKKPGKKGICLNVAQWNKIVESIDLIKAAVEDSAS